jgi:STE24 endopeptidase
VSRRPAALAAGAAALAAMWALAIYVLWRSSVPALDLPHVDPHAFFSPALLHRVDRYARGSRAFWALGTLAQLAALAVFARWGARWMRESAAGRMGTGMLLGMLGFGLVWAAQLPFAVLDVWWQHRYGIDSLGYLDVTIGNWLALGGTFVFLCVALAIVMGFARLVGDWWWAPAAPCFVGLTLLFAFVTPWLLPSDPLHDAGLRRDAARLQAVERVHVPIRVMTGVSEPNAFATGLGPSRRVFLWDPIIEPPFTRRQVDVVMAHELGHLAHEHIWRQIGWYAIFAFPGAFLIARITRRRGGLREPEAVPLSLLVLVALGLLALPLENAVTRHMEAEADWSALQATRDPAAARGLFENFVPATLSQPDPPGWDYVLLENHPTIAQRLAMVEAWQRRYAASDAQSP